MSTLLRPVRIQRVTQRGFTLIELVCSLAIIATLAGISLPLTGAFLRGNNFNATLINIGQAIDLGRQHAIANNTYTWVLLSEPSADGLTITTAVIASQDGNDTLAWETAPYPLEAHTDLRLVSQPVSTPAATVADTSSDTMSGMPDLSESTPGRWGKVQVTLTSGGKQITFTRALQFTPTGQAMSSTSVVRYIQMSLSARNSAGANKAKLLVGGLTGKSQLYRQ